MQSYEVISGPLTDAALWRGALLWALALYVPLSAPLSRLEASLETSTIPENWRQGFLILSSLLLALAVGLATQLGCSWALGPGWASSLGVVVLGWSLLLTLTTRDRTCSGGSCQLISSELLRDLIPVFRGLVLQNETQQHWG